jgi:hypothetical protein
MILRWLWRVCIAMIPAICNRQWAVGSLLASRQNWGMLEAVQERAFGKVGLKKPKKRAKKK